MSKKLRAKLWAHVYGVLVPNYSAVLAQTGPWSEILKGFHVERQHLRIDRYNPNGIIDRIGDTFDKGEYYKIFEWLEYVLQHKNCPQTFPDRIQGILVECQAAYRVVDRTIWPIGSEEEQNAISRAADEMEPAQFGGARTHLRNAASQLTQGLYAASVRESISAVESVARVLEPTGDLSKALAGLEAKFSVHPALKKGFLSLYGYTSDEKGIRHALLSTEDADVDETDALFFIGACASFVTYLINKARSVQS